MQYRAVIFDLDGTLLDTLEDLADSVNYALGKYDYPQRTVEEIRRFVGNGVKVLMERAMPSGIEESKRKACLGCFKEHYAQNMRNKTQPYDGIQSLLQGLHAKGIRIGVVSNKFDVAVKALCQEWFSETVSVAIGESEVIAKKPSPEGVLAAVRALDCMPGEAVYIGDSEVDLQTAKNAAVDCISVLWGFRDRKTLKKNGATVLVETPAQLRRLLLEI